MNYMDEFRDAALVKKITAAIKARSQKPLRVMEVCGGHTLAIRKFGIPQLLPSHIELVSGPGCPVCVTDRTAIDRVIAFSRVSGVKVATYGDLIRVPGSESSLDQEKARGADVNIVYSSLEAIEMARANPNRKIVFTGIGFETTTPASAVAVLEAARLGLNNFFVFSMHKLMPPAMDALIEQGIHIDGYIGPGHVTTIAGAGMYNALVEKHRIAIVVTGFEPVDLLQAILMLVEMHEENRAGVEIQYRRAVTLSGNPKAKEMVSTVFEVSDEHWRGLGKIINSGLRLRSTYKAFDALLNIPVDVPQAVEPRGCICGEVLRGIKRPTDCRLFAKTCTPANPVGACMVSGEGACQAYYNHG